MSDCGGCDSGGGGDCGGGDSGGGGDCGGGDSGGCGDTGACDMAAGDTTHDFSSHNSHFGHPGSGLNAFNTLDFFQIFILPRWLRIPSELSFSRKSNTVHSKDGFNSFDRQSCNFLMRLNVPQCQSSNVQSFLRSNRLSCCPLDDASRLVLGLFRDAPNLQIAWVLRPKHASILEGPRRQSCQNHR